MKRKFVKKKNRSNPFVKKPLTDGFFKRYKIKLKFVFCLVILAGLVYLFFYSPLFKIRKIIVVGSGDTDIINQVRLIAKDEMSGKKWVVWPKSNFFSLETLELDQYIRDNMAVDYLLVEKKLPWIVRIEINEKLPQALWADAKYLYYVDKEGVVMKAMEPGMEEYDLPRISLGTTTEVIIGKKIIEPDNIEFIREIYSHVSAIFSDWSIRETVVSPLKSSELYLYTSEGWYIIINTEIAAGKQVHNLEQLLKQKIEDRSSLRYVDLRIEDKMFYK